MALDKEYIFYLLNQVKLGKAKPEELSALLNLLQSKNTDEVVHIINSFHEDLLVNSTKSGYDFLYWENVVGGILQLDKPVKQKKLSPVVRIIKNWRVAASIFLIFISIFYFIGAPKKKSSANKPVDVSQADIFPGQHGAILTLGDGTLLVLDSAKDGQIAMEEGTEVILKDGSLRYANEGVELGVYNTVSTPKGRQFSLVLPDGTRAWLNAESSIKYLTVFDHKERLVKITGEVYFEVVQNARQPFKVDMDGKGQIQVLGTSFNIKAYEEEEHIYTTLLHGSIQILKEDEKKQPEKLTPNKPVLLQPGQQAILAKATSSVSLRNGVDITKIMAWKNGLFDFENTTLYEVMKQIARWYDVTVSYEQGIPPVRFFGKMSRDISLSGALKALEVMGVQFRINKEKREIVVLP